jgi:hypothetical protein
LKEWIIAELCSSGTFLKQLQKDDYGLSMFIQWIRFIITMVIMLFNLAKESGHSKVASLISGESIGSVARMDQFCSVRCRSSIRQLPWLHEQPVLRPGKPGTPGTPGVDFPCIEDIEGLRGLEFCNKNMDSKIKRHDKCMLKTQLLTLIEWRTF